MLESITVRECATYDAEGVEISNLKKVNFIYGVNGSGKTTITKFVANPTQPAYSSCKKVWKNGVRIQALVYNKDFREDNFGKGSIDGVFTLGKATKDEIQEINDLTASRSRIKEEGVNKKQAIEKLQAEQTELDDALRDDAWKDVYKKYEKVFSGAFAGLRNNKEQFRRRLLEQFGKRIDNLRTLEELREKARTLLDSEPQKLTLLPSIDFEHISAIEADAIWKKPLFGKSDVDIAALVHRLNSSDWLNQGRQYLQDDGTCPFCQQRTITDDFRVQLERYFDETFTRNTDLVKSHSEEYERLASTLIDTLESIETNENEKSDSKLNLTTFSASLKALKSQVGNNKELIKRKIKESSRTLELVSTKAEFIELVGLLDEANTQITKHNLLVANYVEENTLLVAQIWRFLCEEYKDKIDSYNRKRNGLQTGIDRLNEQRSELIAKHGKLEETIRIKNKNVTSVQPAVDEMNRILRCFGYTNFEIVPSRERENQYQIQREDGSIAETTLSEGEITFITFLYFLQLCKGGTSAETITQERILIVDDPISSLDSNILFVVSSLIKEIIKAIKAGTGNIKQLILLTHNVYFHKEASFIDGRTARNVDTHFWILRRNRNKTSVQCFGMENPIKNSYELLWNELKNCRQNSGATIQNTMRRIIEHYFRTLGKFGDDTLMEFFDNAEEKEICRSLLSWINEGSHTIPDDLYVEHQDGTTEKYFRVFEQVFEKTKHYEHYKMMMGDNASMKADLAEPS